MEEGDRRFQKTWTKMNSGRGTRGWGEGGSCKRTTGWRVVKKLDFLSEHTFFVILFLVFIFISEAIEYINGNPSNDG